MGCLSATKMRGRSCHIQHKMAGTIHKVLIGKPNRATIATMARILDVAFR